MDLEELRSFLAVVESGSFLSAADSLGVSRTTLRRRVGALEARAGVPLLETSQSGVVVTEAGNLLAMKGALMVQETSALLSSIRELGKEPSGILRVVMPVGLPPHVLTPIFAALRSAYPLLSIDCRFGNDPLNEPLVDVDIAVHFSDETPKGPWISYVVLKVPERLIASTAYLSSHGTPTTIDDLDKHELFAWHAPGEDPRVWPTLNGSHFRVKPTLVATDVHFIRHCAIAGLGIGFVPDAMLPDPGVPSGKLVQVLGELVGRNRLVRISVPKALSSIPKIKMVLDRVRHFIDEL